MAGEGEGISLRFFLGGEELVKGGGRGGGSGQRGEGGALPRRPRVRPADRKDSISSCWGLACLCWSS